MRRNKLFRRIVIPFACAVLLWTLFVGRENIALALNISTSLPPNIQTVLYSITASNLRGDLSFLASDALQGRFTPSPSLDVAAEYVASEFRTAGLDPGGDQDYFQTAVMVNRRLPRVQSDLTAREGTQTFTVPAQMIAIVDANQGVRIDQAPVVVFGSHDSDLLKNVDLAGKAVVVPQQSPIRSPRDLAGVRRRARMFDRTVAASNAAVEILVNLQRQPQSGDDLLFLEQAKEHRVPSVQVASDQLQKWIDHAGESSEPRTISLDIPAPDDQKVTLKNVVGILRGSDPVLKDTCVLLTAHYDHIGTTETGGAKFSPNRTQSATDHIYNGANDDGSGTVSVIEIAKALMRLEPHPKRSIVFVTFFGEERGELGSQWYSKHPIFPLLKTAADINLEQVGRTDSTEGRELNNASLTGYDYSDVAKYLEDAGQQTGIKLYMDKDGSDAYFTRSDNSSLAEQGVPAHTLTVAFDYPDYHGLADEWQKIDYDNMARVDRMVALGLIDIANSAKAPEWNAQNPKAAPFRDAQEKLRQQH